MHVWWVISIIVYLHGGFYTSAGEWPWLERYHYPGYFTEGPSLTINGTDYKVSPPEHTPDYRIEEPDFVINNPSFAHELERPYRNSPLQKQADKIRDWSPIPRNSEWRMGCFCNTVYRKFVLLAGCATITTRHILTTATPTALILRSYSHLPNLEGILGGWYDISGNLYNSSMYLTPARIHFHPKYVHEFEVNVSHPIPAMYDLSVWAATHRFYGYGGGHQVIRCDRASSSWTVYTHTIPRKHDISIVAGFMFIKSYHRRPLPWFRYIVRTQGHVWPCPKSDWQWFHCIHGEYWGRYGFDSGGGMCTSHMYGDWRRDGIAGLCAFSMKLRSKQIVHYFTVIDTYPVLDFLYDAFLGLIKCVYLDTRFEDTKWAAPIPWWGEHIDIHYTFGEEVYYGAGDVPKYRR